MTSLHHRDNNKIRFIGFIKQPDSDPNPNPSSFEFDESDVVWSSSNLSNTRNTHSASHSPPTLSSSPTTLRRHHHLNHQHPPFHPDKSGLSAALTDDHHPLVRRKSALNPTVSAATAARTIPPVTLLRSEAPGGPRCHQSAPVNVPIWPRKFGERTSGNLGNFDEIEDDGEEEEAGMVPPHEIVARSHVTFSVFEGVGRTLKGRDMRRVRNAVFQKTVRTCGAGGACCLATGTKLTFCAADVAASVEQTGKKKPNIENGACCLATGTKLTFCAATGKKKPNIENMSGSKTLTCIKIKLPNSNLFFLIKWFMTFIGFLSLISRSSTLHMW